MLLNSKLVRDVLNDEQRGLLSPELELLTPNNRNYKCLLMQAAGPIYADATRIGHQNREVAEHRCQRFLRLAIDQGAHLAVTPEYCLPWSVLRSAVTGELFPASDALWALGCESISPEELEAFKLDVQEQCLVIFEKYPVGPAHGTYFDPLVYLFQARTATDETTRIALVQFKTTSSRDPHFLENQHLRVGSTIYRFRNADEHLSFAGVICSDAFAIADNIPLLQLLTSRSILLHIQLNPDPRHRDYRAYRTRTFSFDDDLADCDIICLNWAHSIRQFGQADGTSEVWPKISGSAWYVPRSRCTTNDVEVISNHDKGLYYTCLDGERRHALLLHYDEAVFEFSVSRALTTITGVIANKMGPLLQHRYLWDVARGDWSSQAAPADSGFLSLLTDPEVNSALSGLLPDATVLAIERALALTSGAIQGTDNWFIVKNIDSFIMDVEEIVRRITFAQDACNQAIEFRHSRLQAATALSHILASHPDWPPQVGDMTAGAVIKWDAAYPHCNIYLDGALPALVAYLGSHPSPDRIRGSVDGLFEVLRREGKSHQNRLCICYRLHGAVEFAEIPALTRFDYSGGSRADFTEPLDAVE